METGGVKAVGFFGEKNGIQLKAGKGLADAVKLIHNYLLMSRPVCLRVNVPFSMATSPITSTASMPLA